jgi:hypothetical protein
MKRADFWAVPRIWVLIIQFFFFGHFRVRDLVALSFAPLSYNGGVQATPYIHLRSDPYPSRSYNPYEIIENLVCDLLM